MWYGKIHFLPKHSYNEITKKHLDEYLYYQGTDVNSTYLARGELLTAFLRIDPNSQDSINDFLIIYGISPIDKNEDFERWKSDIIHSQNELTNCIKRYEKMNSDRIKSDNLNSIAKILSLHMKNVIYDIISVLDIPPSINNHKTSNRYGKNPRPNFTTTTKNILRSIRSNNYVLVPEFSSNSIIDLIWVELIECIKNEVHPRRCSCGAYFFHHRHKDKEVCMFCPSPSRRTAKEKRMDNPELYEKEKFINSIKKYISRNKDNPDKINAHLKKHGINKDYKTWEESLRKKV